MNNKIKEVGLNLEINEEKLRRLNMGCLESKPLRRYASILNSIPKSKDCELKVLDVGTGDGCLGMVVQKIFGYEVTGVDIEDIAEKRVKVITVDVENQPIPFREGTFDIVLMSEVLEHLYRRPTFFLNNINKVLKGGGCLILTTPNFLSFYHRILMLRGIIPLYPWIRGDPLTDKEPHGHQFKLYTMEEVVSWLEVSGFKVQEKYYSDPYTASDYGIPLWQKSFVPFKKLLSKCFPKLKPNMVIKAIKVENE